MDKDIWSELKNGELNEGWRAPSQETLAALDSYKELQLGIVATSSEILYRPVQAIPEDEISSRRTQEVVDDLMRVAERLRNVGRRLVGLAAPQIGIDARIFIADVSTRDGEKLGDLTAFVNPSVRNFGPLVKDAEGCFSCPHIFGWPERSRNSEVQAWDPKGQLIETTYELFDARVVQHETDHWDGQVFVDKLVAAGQELHWYPLELRKEYFEYAKRVQEGEEAVWPYLIPSQWAAMRHGTYTMEQFA